MERIPHSKTSQKEGNVARADLSALKLEFVELKAQFTSLSEDVKAISDFIKESQAPKPVNYPAWIGALGTMIFLVCAVLMMWVKPLELKLGAAQEQLNNLERARKDDFVTLRERLEERIAYSYDRLKTEIKLKNQTP
jgi:hypothetical protein